MKESEREAKKRKEETVQNRKKEHDNRRPTIPGLFPPCPQAREKALETRVVSSSVMAAFASFFLIITSEKKNAKYFYYAWRNFKGLQLK